MKCPHCARDGKALATETRAQAGDVYRRRLCGHCGKFFATVETAPPGLKMPGKPQRLSAPASRLNVDTSELAKVWR